MIDIIKLMEAVENFGLMDESNVKLYVSSKAKLDPVRIVVRSRHGAGARAGQVSQHSCSIKVKVNAHGDGIPIRVPVGPVEKMDKKDLKKLEDSLVDSKRKIDAAGGRKELYGIVMQFVYDNQEAIIMLWERPDEHDKIAELLIEYLTDRGEQVDYYSTKRTGWKSEVELKSDRTAIESYIEDRMKKEKKSQ